MEVTSSASGLAEAFQAICAMDAPLNERLAAYASALRSLNSPYAAAYDDLIGRLIAGEAGSHAPSAGDVMPNFILPARNGQLISLQDLTARGPVVVTFNRGHWCPFCRIQLRTLAHHCDAIARHGAAMVAIIPDRQQFAHELRRETCDRLHILTDIDNGYALSMGLVMVLGDTLRELMTARGLHLETYHGSDGWFVPLPATYVVGRDGIIRSRRIDLDFRQRMPVEEILTALQGA